jgi:ankyrin repeat protein
MKILSKEINPLNISCYYGNLELVQLLLKKSKYKLDSTCILASIYSKNYELVKFLTTLDSFFIYDAYLNVASDEIKALLSDSKCRIIPR